MGSNSHQLSHNQSKGKQMTQCFTYEITMRVQVLAETKEEADDKVDSQGGYLNPADRSVKLVAATKLTEPTTKLEPVAKLKAKRSTK